MDTKILKNSRIKKKIKIGNVEIGGQNGKIAVQSMCTTNTCDIKGTLNQIEELYDAGCEIIRLAILNNDAACAIKDIKKKSPIPIVADIHFDYRLALTAIDMGVDALRLNPGNIGKDENVKKVVKSAKRYNIPIRIGINAGSLDKKYMEREDLSLSEKMVESALEHIKILEDNDFDLIKVSLKASDVKTTIDAYRLIDSKINYPLHLGLTEAGTLKTGLIKSSLAFSPLLLEGIGDTIRVSLSENPIEEVNAAYTILRSLNLRNVGINFISCPTCGRCKINLIDLAHKVENKFKHIKTPLTIAVMGCAVNGPGEASHADFGIAGGIGEGYIFKKGEIIKKVKEEFLLSEFENILNQYLTQ